MNALPNLHAALVHFPIVLIPLAVVFECIALAFASSKTLPRVALGMWGLAAGSALATYFAGRSAADGLKDVPARAQLALADHSDAAWLVLFGVGLIFVLRLALMFVEGRVQLAARVVVVVAGLALLLQLVATADRGGGLVYGHALAVSQPAPKACPPCVVEGAAEAVGSTWELKEDGSAVWLPGVGGLAEGVVETVGTLREVTGEEGLTLESDGLSLLLLPGTWSNVQVDATMSTDDFRGTVGVVHGVAMGGAEFGAFTVDTDGAAVLLSLQSGVQTMLDKGRWEVAASSTVSVSVAGSHLKGLVDGKTVSHGHAPNANLEGRVGVLIDGVGVVRILRVDVFPLDGH